LNTEKFRLLNEMAPHVRFPDSGPGITIRSYEPFRREWDAMDELDQLSEIRRSVVGRMLALKSSSAEYTMAQVFRYAFSSRCPWYDRIARKRLPRRDP